MMTADLDLSVALSRAHNDELSVFFKLLVGNALLDAILWAGDVCMKSVRSR